MEKELLQLQLLPYRVLQQVIEFVEPTSFFLTYGYINFELGQDYDYNRKKRFFARTTRNGERLSFVKQAFGYYKNDCMRKAFQVIKNLVIRSKHDRNILLPLNELPLSKRIVSLYLKDLYMYENEFEGLKRIFKNFMFFGKIKCTVNSPDGEKNMIKCVKYNC